MSTSILIIGESGTGKSTAIRTLDPKETFIFNVDHKALPFKSWNKSYNNEGKNINYLYPDPIKVKGNHQYSTGFLKNTLERISETRPEIKNIIIDDAQYIIGNENINRAKERGFDKFTEIGQHVCAPLDIMNHLRKDLILVFMWHAEKRDEDNKIVAYMPSKLIRKHIGLEGKFLYVLYSHIRNGEYMMQTNGDKKPRLRVLKEFLKLNIYQMIYN